MKFSGIVFGLAMMLAGLGVSAQEPIVIKFSHVVAPDTPKGQAAEYFKKLAEERTRRRVRIEIYPDSQLLKDPVELAALQFGAVQMVAPSLSKLGALGLRGFEVFDLPYLFQDYDEVHRVTAGAVGQSLLKSLDSKGIVGLAFWDNGFKQMSANRPLRLPTDMRGLKMRIQASKVLASQMRTLGAIPEPMAFSDVYQAARTGVVDGTESSMSNFYTQNMDRVQKHLTLSNHGYLGYVVMVNKKFWDDLPGDIRDILAAAMKDATRFANDAAKKKNEEALEAVKKAGRTRITSLTPEEKQLWVGALSAVHQEQAQLLNKDLLQAIYRETGFDRVKHTHASDNDQPGTPGDHLWKRSQSWLVRLGY